MPRWHHWRMFDVMTKGGICDPLFFLRLGSSDRPKFLSFSKKKSNDLVKPFFTWNNSLIWKIHIVINSIKKNRNIFYSYIMYLNMWMLSFEESRPGVPGPPTFPDYLRFFFSFFFSIRPTNPISGNQETIKGTERASPIYTLFHR